MRNFFEELEIYDSEGREVQSGTVRVDFNNVIYEENISVSSFGKDYTVDQILNILEADGYDTEPDFKLIEKKEKEIDNKNIKYNTYSFNYNGDKNIVTYSTITFDEDSEYIIVFSQTSIEEAYDEEELFDIYKSIELKE